MNATAQKKITAATFKAFVRKNREALQIATKSRFDGMVDGSVSGSGKFSPVRASRDNGPFTMDDLGKHDCGIAGVWLVGRSRDWFQEYNKDGFTGIEVSNSCGCFIVAIPNGEAPAPDNVIPFTR